MVKTQGSVLPRDDILARLAPPRARESVGEARPQHLGITSIYLQGIDNAEIIDTIHARPTPTVQVTALLHR